MGRRDALASLTGRVDAEKRAAYEVARDIDWVKVRRVQHGLNRPPGIRASSSGGLFSHEEMENSEARSGRATRLAHGFALVTGVLLGLSFLREFDAAPLLLAASISLAATGLVAAWRAASY